MTKSPIPYFFFSLILLILACPAPSTPAAEYQINGHVFTAPDGMIVEQIAGPPLVDRPVSADFDERGRLYVTDSSGSNDPLEVQRQERPHRIVRLEDVDGDGKFDNSTVFADRLMFPEGALWFDGSLYVAAPPEIWKFTDADDDGVAEQREVWFDGKTLTHCGNDLHGPYLGPDGWMYWCKGAFAEQTYERPGRSPWTTRAAHIFRRRPEGGPLETVMTGGMDNPVEVVFTPGGERIFTTTFLVHPTQGRRDGLIHAIYGGVYGKDHGVLDNHPRTGELMPPLVHLDAAAPCGLARLESDGLGRDYRDNVLACCFNLHKVTRHVLTPHGASFVSETTDLLSSNHLDFHPTDVLEDANGSVIVIDTGGWFRLCCPTSQLEKPDVLGGIYRIRRRDAPLIADPRGQNIPWQQIDDTRLVQLLADHRPAVRRRALRQISQGGAGPIQPLRRVLTTSDDSSQRLLAIWALTRIDHTEARKAVRAGLLDADATVRQAALHSVSIWKDTHAVEPIIEVLTDGPAHNRRAAAEALGRLGSTTAVDQLLAAIPSATIPQADGPPLVDRWLEHSLIYATIELGDAERLRGFMDHPDPRIQRAALIALDQLQAGDALKADDIQHLLVSEDSLLNETAWWIVQKHADWGDTVVDAFRAELAQPATDSESLLRLSTRLQRFSQSPAVQYLMADALMTVDSTTSFKIAIMDAMARSGRKQMPNKWQSPLTHQLSQSEALVAAALTVFTRLESEQLDQETLAVITQLARDQDLAPELRLKALNAIPSSSRDVTAAELEFVCSRISVEVPVSQRALAVDYLTLTSLNSEQLQRVAQQLPQATSLELHPLLKLFENVNDAAVGNALVDALLESPTATSLLPNRLAELLSPYGEDVAQRAAPLLAKIEHENASKVERVNEVIALLPQADARRGLQVFQSSQASCIACHRRGYLGGNIGPDLNRIGRIRDERALLESILFPSLTFVRSYEPISIVTVDGRVFQGLIRDQTEDTVTLQLDANKSVQLPTALIEEQQIGTTSIMPAGLEKQLTPQDLADLVKYLKDG